LRTFFDHLEKLKAKRSGVRIQDFSKFSINSHIIMEEHSRLGDVKVKLANAEQPLSVGAYSYIREGSEIYQCSSIGRFCAIGRNVVLGQPADNHPVDWASTSMSVSKNYIADSQLTTIGHDVWIAHDVVIMAGVNIGHGAVIGRNAVVTKDVDAYQIVVGNPSKVVRTRFEGNKIERLLKSQWWDVNFADLSNLSFGNVDKFLQDITSYKRHTNYKTTYIKNRKVVKSY